MRVSAEPRPLKAIMRRDGGGTYTGRDCGVGIEVLGQPCIVGWGSPAHYPEWWVIVCEPYPHDGHMSVLVAPQEFWLEWQLDPQGRAYPPGTIEAPTGQVYLPDHAD